MLENTVFIGLRKEFKDIFYFQGRNECDFLVKEKDKITHAIQVCLDFNEENKDREINVSCPKCGNKVDILYD